MLRNDVKKKGQFRQGFIQVKSPIEWFWSESFRDYFFFFFAELIYYYIEIYRISIVIYIFPVCFSFFLMNFFIIIIIIIYIYTLIEERLYELKFRF